MLRVTYLSQETAPFTPAELLSLLEHCHANNPARGLTGLLIYGNGTFLQTLEGEDAVVEALIETISKDPRHHSLQVVQRQSTDRRRYEGWSMGFERLTAEALAGAPALGNFMLADFNPRYLSTHPDVMESLLERHRSSHWDPLVRELDAREQFTRELQSALAASRQRNEMAALLIEAVIDGAARGRLEDSHLKLCRSVLASLREADR